GGTVGPYRTDPSLRATRTGAARRRDRRRCRVSLAYLGATSHASAHGPDGGEPPGRPVVVRRRRAHATGARQRATRGVPRTPSGLLPILSAGERDVARRRACLAD